MFELNIFTLPDVLIRIIQLFLSKDDYHYFLNTSKKFFELKRKTIYFSLKRETSLQYIKDPVFKALVLGKVENGWKQIAIRFKNYDPLPKEFSRELPIHSIYLPEISQQQVDLVKHIERLQSLIHRGSTSPLLSQTVKELSLIGVRGLVDVRNFSQLRELDLYFADKLTDIAPLQNIPSLAFVECNSIKDFSCLTGRNQKSLKIFNSSFLTDVSTFSGIRDLALLSCHGLKNISPLYGIYNLSLCSCSKICDISPLGNHHRLVIEDCSYDLKGYGSLTQIPHVQLKNCNINDLNILKNSKTISLSRCSLVEDVAPLINARKVIIDNCPNIKNLSELKNVPNLTIIAGSMNSEDFVEVSSYNFTLKLLTFEVSHYYLFSNIKVLTIVPDENLATCINKGQATFFEKLQSLTIEENFFLQSVNGLGIIPIVKLLDCSQLTNIDGLGQNREVELRSCPLITNVRSLSRVSIVTIVKCNKIEDYSCLSHVERLKVVE